MMGEGMQIFATFIVSMCIAFGMIEFVIGDDKKAGALVLVVGVILLRLRASGIL